MNLSRMEFQKIQRSVMAMPGEPVYARLCLRKLSLVITPLIARFPVTPNMLTLSSIIAGIIGAVLLMVPSWQGYWFGLLLVFAWYFLDVLDGDLARYKHLQSLKGVYLDTIGHYLVNPLIFASFSIYLSVVLNNRVYIILGFVAFITHQYSRLATDIYHSVKYVQIDPNANPRQVINNVVSENQAVSLSERVVSLLQIPASYLLDIISVTLIFGLLRLIMDHGFVIYSIAIYLALVFAVFAGTTLIILNTLKKL